MSGGELAARLFVVIAGAAAALAGTAAFSPLAAQRVPPPAPSRAAEYLAVGRLALAERELYASVAAEPREPAHRGALARYLASRGRFRIAEVLYGEALRFGADTAAVARGLAQMASYRAPAERRAIAGVRTPSAIVARERARSPRGAPLAESLDGPAVTVPITMTEDGRTLAFLWLTVRGASGDVLVRATIDPTREGVAVASADDPAFAMRAFGGRGAGTPVLMERLSIGERTLEWIDAYVDPAVPPGEVRIGIDIFWRLRPVIDERAGTMTLPFAGERTVAPPRASHLPVMLAFPGLMLVPSPGVPPFGVESAEGRAYLRGTRWRLDPANSTIIVER